MVERAFFNADNYLSFFKEIDEMHKVKQSALNNALTEIHEKYGHLLDDDDFTIEEPAEFLPPEFAKPKGGSKAKFRSSQATSNRSVSVARKSRRDTRQNALESSVTEANCSLRKSSRIAKKGKTHSISASNECIREEDGVAATGTISKDIQLNGSRNFHINEIEERLRLLSLSEISVNTEKMKDPLGYSTPTVASPEVPHFVETVSHEHGEGEQIAISKPENEEKTDSVKKRVEEFEKRAKGLLQPVKLPIKTPEKKIFRQPTIIPKKKKIASIVTKSKPTTTRVLREKNANNADYHVPKIKIVEKKPMNKQKAEDLKSKRDERVRKLASQREATEKKELEDAVEVKKVPACEQSENDMELEIPAYQVKKNESGPKTPQYPLDHIESGCSEDEDHPKSKIPLWATKQTREYPLKVQAWLDKKETVYKWFHNKNLKTPNLEELFSYKVKMRPRTSSAVWNTKSFFK